MFDGFFLGRFCKSNGFELVKHIFQMGYLYLTGSFWVSNVFELVKHILQVGYLCSGAFWTISVKVMYKVRAGVFEMVFCITPP